MLIDAKTQPNGTFSYVTDEGSVTIKIEGNINIRINIDINQEELKFNEQTDFIEHTKEIKEVVTSSTTIETSTICTTKPRALGGFRLTREKIKEIIDGVMAGFNNKEIAELTGVNPNTVRSIRKGESRKEILEDLNYDPSKAPQIKRGKQPILFSREQIEVIVKDISSGEFTNKEIAQRYNISEALVSSIKTGRTYKNILNEIGYIPTKSGRGLTIDEIHEVCKMIQAGESNSIIADHFRVSADYISLIKNKRIHKAISDQYNYEINNRPSIQGHNHPNAKLSETEVRKACELLFTRGLSVKEVCNIMNMDYNVIYNIYNNNGYRNIVTEYINR